MSQKPAVYTHGHHESVLRSHSWRTAVNSAGYLLSSLKPHMHILDVGCGPGTITVDFAALVPEGKVIGLEYAPDVLDKARVTAAERGLSNIQFVTGDIHALDFPDDTFDVVHAHQVLQHVTDPVQALREMRRVTKPGGIVAVRDGDFGGFVWYPETKGMLEWHDIYLKVARANGGDPFAGRKLRAWATQAGFDVASVTSTASTWCYSTPEEIAWWSTLWADRTVSSSFASTAIKNGLADDKELARISQIWRDWGAEKDAWFAILHGEIICRV